MAKSGSKKEKQLRELTRQAGVRRQKDRICDEALDQGRAVFSKDFG